MEDRQKIIDKIEHLLPDADMELLIIILLMLM